MKIAVVYESLYGNTRHIAEAVADSLSAAGEAALINVRDAAPELLDGLDLLVAGGPTHVHGMSSRSTRKGAATDAQKKGHAKPDVGGGPLRDWLDGLSAAPRQRAAAFDTRIDKPKLLVGSAAKGIARRLEHAGFAVIGEESFLVSGTDGPLLDGEIERARTWGKMLVAVPTHSG